MEKNLMTVVMEKMHGMLSNTDAKLKEYGVMEYGKRKATKREKERMFEELTPERLNELVSEHGRAEVNEWLKKQMEG